MTTRHLTVLAAYRLSGDGLVTRDYTLGHLALPENKGPSVSRSSLADLRRPDWAWELSLPDGLRADAIRAVLAVVPETEALAARMCSAAIRHREPRSGDGAYGCKFDATIDIGRTLTLSHAELRLTAFQGRGRTAIEFPLRTWEQHGPRSPIKAHQGLSRPALGDNQVWKDWLADLDELYRPAIADLFAHLADVLNVRSG